jgi:hypothetical protein
MLMRTASTAAILVLGLMLAASAEAHQAGQGQAGPPQMGQGMMGQGYGQMGPGMMGPGMMGQGMGPGMMGQGYGQMGPGMMGPGMMGQGMGPGMMGPGMMGQGMGPGMMGQGHGPMGPSYGSMAPGMMHGFRVVPMTRLSTEDVQAFLQHHIAMDGLQHLKVGEVKQTDENTITADIVTQDGSLALRLEIDPYTGLVKNMS